MSSSDKITPLAKISALILAGGAGRRFAGLDKGLQTYNGKPLIKHVIDAVQPQVSEMMISVNRHHQSYEKYGFKLVTDALSEDGESFPGPMAGIVAAIKQLEKGDTEALLVATCDSPKLPHDYISVLIEAVNGSESSVAVVHDGQRRQNLHCLIKREAWNSLSEFYAQGNRAMHQWCKRITVQDVDFSDQAGCFININSPSQLERL